MPAAHCAVRIKCYALLFSPSHSTLSLLMEFIRLTIIDCSQYFAPFDLELDLI